MACRDSKVGVAARGLTDKQVRESLPEGTPEWITPQMIRDVIRIWQPRRKRQITATAAVKVIMETVALSDGLIRLVKQRVRRRRLQG